MASTGRLFVISSPSGAGKTTLIRRVLAAFPGVSYSVSHTTRVPRPREINGKDYFFIKEDRFVQMIQDGEWLEWARVHGNYYGTSLEFVQEQLEAGQNLLLDIDVQGARHIMASGLDPVTVFIMPPDLDELRRRLEHRGTDSTEIIALRLGNARQEMAARHLFRHVLVNDDLEATAGRLIAIFADEMGEPPVAT